MASPGPNPAPSSFCHLESGWGLQGRLGEAPFGFHPHLPAACLYAYPPTHIYQVLPEPRLPENSFPPRTLRALLPQSLVSQALAAVGIV